MATRRLRADLAVLATAAALLLLWPALARAQERRFAWSADSARVTIRVIPDSLRLRLSSGWIRPESFRLTRGDSLLTRGVDYLLDPRRGTVRLLRPFPAGTELEATYRHFPLEVLAEYARRPVVRAGEEPPPVAPATTGTPRADAADAAMRFDIRGSKTFAVEVGTRRDLALQQSLDLTVDGRLGRDTRVRAVLTDRRTPLTADGTSSRLGDLDRVRVEVEAREAKMTLGDLRFTAPPGEFLRFDRSLQGAEIEATPGHLSGFAVGATAPGTYLTREFRGQEGRQGPYALAPADTNGTVGGVVPGSERVWLDGAQLARGESEDYLVDYAGGTLTFTGRHPITAYSEITVEYQVALDRYRRSVYGTGGEWTAGAVEAGAVQVDRGRFRVALVSEGDDKGRPLFPLTTAQRAALQAAGDSLTAELTTGVRFTGAGAGEYDRVQNDTLAVSFFLWAGPGRGSYLVRFDEVGDGKGDYRDTTDTGGTRFFVYAGKNHGAFLPGTEVPRPARTSIVSLAAAPDLGHRYRLRGELAISEHDANTFSARDDGDNRGAAWLLESGAGPFPAGPVALSVRGVLRETEARFHPLDKLDPAFFARDWNIDAARLASGDRRTLVEGRASAGRASVGYTAETLDNLRDFRADRGTLAAGVKLGPVEGDARVVRVQTRDRGSAGSVSGARAVERTGVAWSGRLVSTSARYAHERNERGAGAARTGEYFREGALRIGTGSGLEAVTGSVEWTRRVRWALRGLATEELDTGDTGQLSAQWNRPGGRVVAADLAARELAPRDGARQSSRVGRVRWLERAAGDAFLQEGRWELTTSARGGREKEVRFVGAGTGRYDSLGTFTGVGDYEVFYRDRTDSARVNRMDFSLRHEYDAGRGASSGETAPAGGWARFRRGLRLVQSWTAGIETRRSAGWFWPRLLPVLAGEREVPFAEVRLSAEGSAYPDSRWFAPQVRWNRRRHQQALLANAAESGTESTWALRLRSRPGDRSTVDTEGEWESVTQRTEVTGRGAGLDGWRSLRVRIDPQVRVRTPLSVGTEAWARRRARVGTDERARVFEATPYLVWTPRSRSRVELRVTRTSVDRRGGAGAVSRLLEVPGWNARLVATLRLRDELDLSAWYRERRPDRGLRDREGRMELRASF